MRTNKHKVENNEPEAQVTYQDYSFENGGMADIGNTLMSSWDLIVIALVSLLGFGTQGFAVHNLCVCRLERQGHKLARVAFTVER